MFRTVLLSALAAFASAGRVQIVGKFESQNKFGASCDDLQTMFQNRLNAFQTSLDAIPDMDAMSRVSQARVMMRTSGIIRTLRRARTCAWVIQNDSDEIEQARGIVQSLLAGNPCAENARSELASGLSAETAQVELASIRRAMSILSSDSCEPTEIPEEAVGNSEGTDLQLTEAEDNLADAIEAMEEGQSSFLQTGSVRGFMRGVGVAFLMLFLLLACASAVALIAGVIGYIIALLLANAGACSGMGCLGLLYIPMGGGAGGLAVGMAGCSYQLYTQLLPQLNSPEVAGRRRF